MDVVEQAPPQIGDLGKSMKSVSTSSMTLRPFLLSGVMTVIITSLSPTVVSAQEPSREAAATACRDAADLVEEQESDIDEALSEAQWCLEIMQQLKKLAMSELFPARLMNYTARPGDTANGGGIFGMNMESYTYEDEKAGTAFEVSLLSGAAGSGLAALASVGLQLSGAEGMRQRIQRRMVTRTSSPEDVEAQFMVELLSGGSLTFSSSTLSAEQLLDVIKAFPLRELDDALN